MFANNLIAFFAFLLAIKRCESHETTSYAKCCKEHQHLVNTTSGYLCQENTFRTSYFIHKTLNKQAKLCVDQSIVHNKTRLILLNDTTLIGVLNPKNSYRKCCPFGSIYETLEHKCVPSISNNHSSLFKEGDSFMVHVGIRCNQSVIIDKYHDKLPVIWRPPSKHCVDETTNSRYVIRECNEIDECKSSSNPEGLRCIRKCCPDGFMYNNSKRCSRYPTFSHGIVLANMSVDNPQSPFAVISGAKCTRHLMSQNEQYLIDDDGVFHSREFVKWYSYDIAEEKYCVEYIVMGKRNGYFMMGCEKIPFWPTKRYCSMVALPLSCFFLAITIVVYAFLYNTHNVYGKCLICYCCCLFVTFMLLAILHFNPNMSTTVCPRIGYSILFAFIAAFTWLNVMCFDMWWTFGTVRSAGMNQKQKARRKFILYNIYGWLTPLSITLFAFIAYKTKCFPEIFLPKIGSSICVIEKTTYGYFIYHVAPIAVLTVANFVLFVKTTYYCIKVKGEINRLRDASRKKRFLVDKERLMLLFKLSIVMGVPFTFEVISSVVSFKENEVSKAIGLFFDIINSLQGVFIFIIFVLKKKVITEVLKKFGVQPIRKISQTMTSTAVTSLQSSNNERRISKGTSLLS